MFLSGRTAYGTEVDVLAATTRIKAVSAYFSGEQVPTVDANPDDTVSTLLAFVPETHWPTLTAVATEALDKYTASPLYQVYRIDTVPQLYSYVLSTLGSAVVQNLLSEAEAAAPGVRVGTVLKLLLGINILNTVESLINDAQPT